MAIGKRIQFLRSVRGMTQRELGVAIGLEEKGADNRIAQYETDYRIPKRDLQDKMAEALDVVPNALSVPDIDSYVGLMHTLFTREDCYGLRVCKCSGKVHIGVDSAQSEDAAALSRALATWWEKFSEMAAGIITKEEYDHWRYHYEGECKEAGNHEERETN